MSPVMLTVAAPGVVLAATGSAGAYDLTTGRLWSLVGAGIALAGIAAGGVAVVRASRGGGRTARVLALAAGLVGAVVGALVVAAAEGGPGTGYGMVGGVVAVVLGAVGVALGGWALVRGRRSVPASGTASGRRP